MLLGGRAAEMVVYDEVTTGAENDLKEASGLARRMVGLWGMSTELGPVYLGTGEEHVFLGREIMQDKAYSDATANRLDSAVREMVESALDRAVKTTVEHRDKLDALVAALLEHETLDGKEVIGDLRTRPYPRPGGRGGAAAAGHHRGGNRRQRQGGHGAERRRRHRTGRFTGAGWRRRRGTTEQRGRLGG